MSNEQWSVLGEIGYLLAHCLHTNAPLVREEHKNLLHWVVLVIREEVELTATGSTLNKHLQVGKS